MKINLAIAGGCFLEQHNIPFDKLYHQILKQSVEKISGCELRIGLIRYERFVNCLEKIRSFNEKNPADILLFHIRSEHFLRIVKLYYKFSDTRGYIKHSLNLPLLKILNPEKYDLLTQKKIQPVKNHIRSNFPSKNSGLHRFLVGLNYAAGFTTGNYYFALNSYFSLVKNVAKYCKEKNIRLIIAGPASRPHTWLEDFLTERLHNFMKNSIDAKNITYINCLGKFSEKNDPMFFENGIHVSESGHRRIARLILSEFNFVIDQKISQEQKLNKLPSTVL
jgi:hypothetical protein